MKFLFIIAIVIIAACSPSEEAIQAAIAETDIARPTETAFPSPTPPTRTPEPTPEPIPLEDTIIRYAEFLEVDFEISQSWKSGAVEINCLRTYRHSNDCYSLLLSPAASFVEAIRYHIVRFESKGDSMEANERAKASAELLGRLVRNDMVLVLPDSIWFAVRGNAMQVGFALNNYNFLITMNAVSGQDPADLRAYLALVAQKQADLIETIMP